MITIPDARHPNSPLVEVVFEIRFPGETAIECRRHEIQDRIRNDYSHLLVPNVQTGVAYALEPYRFEKPDASAGIMVSLGSFAYYSRAYPGYEQFRHECLRLIDLFGTLIPVSRLTRVGLRHRNLIPFHRENGLVPFDHYFQLGQSLTECLDGRFENVNLAFVMPASDGKITTRIESVIRTDRSQEAFLLDFDYAREAGLDFPEVATYLDQAHDESAALFHRLITPTYRDYIRGEEV